MKGLSSRLQGSSRNLIFFNYFKLLALRVAPIKGHVENSDLNFSPPFFFFLKFL